MERKETLKNTLREKLMNLNKEELIEDFCKEMEE